MSNLFKLTVPFLYEASVLPPRCRKPEPRIVRDSIDVELVQYADGELKTAIIGTNYKDEKYPLLWNGESLIQQDFESVVGKPKRVVTIDEVVKNTEDCTQYPYSCPGVAAPFNNCWQDVRGSVLLKRAFLKDSGVLQRSEIGKMNVVSDNREQVIALIKKIASSTLISDGVMMCYGVEPTYYTITFGLSGNQGTTSIAVGGYVKGKLEPVRESEFNILQLDYALAYATKIAESRGNNQSLPIRVSDRFEVLLPEAIKMPMRSPVLPM